MYVNLFYYRISFFYLGFIIIQRLPSNLKLIHAIRHNKNVKPFYQYTKALNPLTIVGLFSVIILLRGLRVVDSAQKVLR